MSDLTDFLEKVTSVEQIVSDLFSAIKIVLQTEVEKAEQAVAAEQADKPDTQPEPNDIPGAPGSTNIPVQDGDIAPNTPSAQPPAGPELPNPNPAAPDGV
jgi:hypothetical protein